MTKQQLKDEIDSLVVEIAKLPIEKNPVQQIIFEYLASQVRERQTELHRLHTPIERMYFDGEFVSVVKCITNMLEQGILESEI